MDCDHEYTREKHCAMCFTAAGQEVIMIVYYIYDISIYNIYATRASSCGDIMMHSIVHVNHEGL